MILHAKFGNFEFKLTADERKYSYRLISPGVDVRGQFADDETWAEQIDKRFGELLKDARGTDSMVIYANLREAFHVFTQTEFWENYMSPARAKKGAK